MENLSDKKILRMFEDNSNEIERLRERNKTNLTNIQEAISELQGSTVDPEQVEQLEQDVDSLEESVNKLKQQISILQGEVDPNYSGKTYSDYPAGTILQTYDKLERQLDMNSSTVLTSPKIYFCTEAGSTGKIRLYTKFKQTVTATSVLMKVYLNGTKIAEETFEIIMANNDVHILRNYFDLYFNADSKSNYFYITLESEGSANSNNINLNALTLELFAPNADIITRPCPFDAVYANGKYYLTNCIDGTVKTAVIDEESFTKVEDIAWTSTDIVAEECKTTFSMTIFNETYKPLDPYYVKHKNDKYYFGTLENNIESCEMTMVMNADPVFYSNANPHFIVARFNNTYMTRGYYNLANSTNQMGFATGGNVGKLYIRVGGLKYNNINYTTKMTLASAIITADGEVQFRPAHTGSNNFISLGYGSDVSVILTSFTNSSIFSVAVFVKRFDKIIRYDLNIQYSTYTITKTTEIGSYEKVFFMPNNAYFAIKNNQLCYYKIPLEARE